MPRIEDSNDDVFAHIPISIDFYEK